MTLRPAALVLAVFVLTSCKPRVEGEATSNLAAVALPTCTPEARQDLEDVLTKNALNASSMRVDFFDPPAEAAPPAGTLNPQIQPSTPGGLRAASRDPDNVKSLDLDASEDGDVKPVTVETLNFLACMPKLNSLSLTGVGVKDFTGIGTLQRLSSLFVKRTALADIRFMKGMVSLQYVLLPENRLSDVQHLMFLTLVTFLDLSANGGIKNLMAVEGLTELKYLRIPGNAVTDLTPLKGLPGLVHLEAQANELTSVSGLERLPSLQSINLSRNRIADIDDVGDMPNLAILQLENNCLKAFDRLERFPNLTQLHLQANPLKTLPSKVKLERLGLLNLSDTLLTGIDPLAEWEVPNLGQLVLDRLKAPDVNAVSRLTSLNMLMLREGEFETAPDLSAMKNLEGVSYLGAKIRRLDLNLLPPTIPPRVMEVISVDVTATSLEEISPNTNASRNYFISLATDDAAYAKKLNGLLPANARTEASERAMHPTPLNTPTAGIDNPYPPKLLPEKTPYLRGACPDGAP